MYHTFIFQSEILNLVGRMHPGVHIIFFVFSNIDNSILSFLLVLSTFKQGNYYLHVCKRIFFNFSTNKIDRAYIKSKTVWDTI